MISLGLDCGTSSFKAVVVDSDIVKSVMVVYDDELPEFGTNGGVVHEKGRIFSNPMMWAAALKMVLEKLGDLHVDAISVSAQQHSSVYWSKGAKIGLYEVDNSSFATLQSPVWMDSSTTSECKRLSRFMGGDENVAFVTGSVPHERFTGNQIASMAKRIDFSGIERISLASSFITSLLIGEYAPIDLSDGSGMNILDIRTHEWNKDAIDATNVPNLTDLLGIPVPSSTIVGRCKFLNNCPVVAGSGDNPCTLACLQLINDGDVGISLGTSDTVLESCSTAKCSSKVGHVFVHPMDSSMYMRMLCFKNGAIARELVRSKLKCEWKDFPIDASPPGHMIGFFYPEPEILPAGVQGIYRFGEETDWCDSDARAVVESQILSMRLHLKSEAKRIIVTGGASMNKAILQIIADVFGTDVYTCTQHGGALGAAVRASHGVSGKQPHQAATSAASPRLNIHQVYSEMLPKFEMLLQSLS